MLGSVSKIRFTWPKSSATWNLWLKFSLRIDLFVFVFWIKTTSLRIAIRKPFITWPERWPEPRTWVRHTNRNYFLGAPSTTTAASRTAPTPPSSSSSLTLLPLWHRAPAPLPRTPLGSASSSLGGRWQNSTDTTTGRGQQSWTRVERGNRESEVVLHAMLPDCTKKSTNFLPPGKKASSQRRVEHPFLISSRFQDPWVVRIGREIYFLPVTNVMN